jgi:hypothetical protein
MDFSAFFIGPRAGQGTECEVIPAFKTPAPAMKPAGACPGLSR